MTDDDRLKLLHGPYRPPPLRKGDRATCLFRDGDVVVTGWSAGRISWPRCRSLGTRGGGSGLLVDDELARAVRNESAAAVKHWWGVTTGVVWRWRRALGVGLTDGEGSRRLIAAAAREGGAAMRERGVTEGERAQRRRRSRALGTARHLKKGYHGPVWTADQLALLGTMPDAEVAAMVGRTPGAVTCKRNRLGVPRSADGRRR